MYVILGIDLLDRWTWNPNWTSVFSKIELCLLNCVHWYFNHMYLLNKYHINQTVIGFKYIYMLMNISLNTLNNVGSFNIVFINILILFQSYCCIKTILKLFRFIVNVVNINYKHIMYTIYYYYYYYLNVYCRDTSHIIYYYYNVISICKLLSYYTDLNLEQTFRISIRIDYTILYFIYIVVDQGSPCVCVFLFLLLYHHEY